MTNFLSLITKNRTPFKFKFGNQTLMDLEIVEEIIHNMSSTVTTNSSSIAKKSDNINNDPIVLEMKCRITNEPIVLLANLEGAISSVLPANPIFQKFAGTTITKLTNKALNRSDNRRQDAFNMLVDIRNKKTPFSVVTGLKAYDNMFFTNLSIVEDKTAINALVFTCTIQEVPIITSNTINVGGINNKGVKELIKNSVGEGSILYNTLTKFF